MRGLQNQKQDRAAQLTKAAGCRCSSRVGHHFRRHSGCSRYTHDSCTHRSRLGTSIRVARVHMLGWTTNKTPSLLHVSTFINIIFVSLDFHSPVSSLHSLFHLTPSSVTFNVIVTSAHIHRHSTYRHYHFHWSFLPFSFIVTSTRPINRVFRCLVHQMNRQLHR